MSLGRRILTGDAVGPLLMLHGGAGDRDQKGDQLRVVSDRLQAIAAALWPRLAAGGEILDLAAAALTAMEESGLYTAGNGAFPQADGQYRLTAALMDGARQRFSGVINATYQIHPGQLARRLQERSSRVVSEPGATLLAREAGIAPVLPDSGRTREFNRGAWGGPVRFGTDTVGCVIRGADGRLVAATSTGGLANAFPGRISDSATVAGTYASGILAVSATGWGEEIVDDAVAARLETRRRDGMALADACGRGLDEAVARGRDYGWICCDAGAAYGIAYTSETMSYVVTGEAGVLARS